MPAGRHEEGERNRLELKRINRAAKAAFLSDRALRAKFNLDILYRNVSTRKPTAVVPATHS